MSWFLVRALGMIVRRRFRARETALQIRFVGNRSVGLICLTSAFTGMVLALQGYNALVRFGSESQVGSLVALSLTRELAPVLTALMVTARAGSAMAATVGSMRIGEQIDALRSMSIDPIHYLVTPRLVATVIVLPLLTAAFSLVGLAAADLFGALVLHLDAGEFESSVHSATQWADVSLGIYKSLVFAVMIAWIATYRGYVATGGAVGVGRATTSAVVAASVVILMGDYVMTALFF